MSTELSREETVEMPAGVTAALDNRTLTVKGRLGQVRKNFDKINVNLDVQGGAVKVSPYSRKKRDGVVVSTASSLVRNMVTGVTKGYTYKLKVAYAHFPITVKVKGSQIMVENFVGERSPRVANTVGDCKVSVEGDDVIVKGVSLEDVGQTAANVELATKIKKKDQRVFLDGIYIYEKLEGE